MICRRKGNKVLVLSSKEGITQGNSFSMTIYGVDHLFLVEMLREESPKILQPWYADNNPMQGKARHMLVYFQMLMDLGCVWVEPSSIQVLIHHLPFRG